jgi:hypothetical protein
MKTLRLDWRKTRYDNSKTVAFKLQSCKNVLWVNYIFYAKLLCFRKAARFSPFLLLYICFEPLKNLTFQNLSPNYKLYSNTKRFDDVNLVFIFVLYFVVCIPAQIQHGGFKRALLFSNWTPVTWPSTHSRSNISMNLTNHPRHWRLFGEMC